MGAPDDTDIVPDRRASRDALVDAGRAVAATMVVILHSGLYSGLFANNATLARVVRHFNAGVPALLAISGYLLYRPFARSNAGLSGGRPDLKVFLRRRLLRIYPAYWVVLTIVGFAYPARHVFSFKNAVVLYPLLQAWSSRLFTSGVGQTWTVSVEIAFYLTLPLIAAAVMWLTRTRRLSWEVAESICVLGLLALSIGWILWVSTLGGIVAEHNVPRPPQYLPAFALGMGLAVLSVNAERVGGWSAVWRRVLQAPMVWAGCLAVLLVGSFGYPPPNGAVLIGAFTGRRFLGETAVYILFGVLLVVPMLVNIGIPGPVRRILSSSFVSMVGRASYGLYLWQFVALDIIRRTGLHLGNGPANYLAWAIAACGLSFAFGWLSWILIERPAIQLSHRQHLIRAPRPAVQA